MKQFYPGERQAVAIKEAKSLAFQTSQDVRAAQDSLQALQARLFTISAVDKNPDIQALLERVDAINRSFNAMESGTFALALHSRMEEAWMRLP